MSQPRFIPGHDAPARPRDTALLFVTRGLDLLIAEREGTGPIPTGAELPGLATEAIFLGTLEGVDCYATGIPKDTEPPTGMKLVPARSLYGRVDEALFGVVGRALAIAEWDITHRFCGRDGQPTVLVPGERARRCPVCRTPYYPRISPAVIVLVTRGDSMLLARNANFPNAFFSTLAGFVDVGESLEETVVREVKEEVGVDIQNLRYFSSQPWPFGRSLMVGFTADNHPQLPPRLSIARKLIDSFLARAKGQNTPG